MEFSDRIMDYILIPQVENVTLTEKTKNKNFKLEGTLCTSGHHLILSSRERDIQQELWLLVRNIDVLEKKTNSPNPGGSLILKCKDFRILHLHIPSTEDLSKLTLSIENLLSLEQTKQYPFFHRPQLLSNCRDVEDGWVLYTPLSEWSRLLSNGGDEWQISNLNSDYQVCSSYPSEIIVPRNVGDDIIVSSANFRDGGRFPILCYRHEKGGILLRSSQPMCGGIGKRCRGDEILLNSFLRPGKRGVIVDTRSVTQAQSARGRGGGTEIDAAYPQWLKSHKSVPRPSELMESLSKLIDACNDTSCSTSQWLSKLESSKWLSAVRDVMNAACVTAQCLEQKETAVLVHGGSGRDTTLAVCSLVQMILNPECRTIRGLQALIEREWLHAGHAFFTRTRHGAYYTSHFSQNNSHAPTFLLFLDALYQLHFQFQLSFEYTTEFLIELFKNCYYSNCGTFLCDSEAERSRLKLSERTYSLWTTMNQPQAQEKWLNPLYQSNSNIIWPSVAPISIQLWKELYLGNNEAAPWDGWLQCMKEHKKSHSSVRKAAVELHASIRQVIEELESDSESALYISENKEPIQLSRL